MAGLKQMDLLIFLGKNIIYLGKKKLNETQTTLLLKDGFT